MKRYSKVPKTEKTEEQMLSEAKKWTAVAGAAVLLLAAVLLSLWVFPQKNDSVENTSWAMGSYVQQTLYGDGAEETATEAASAVSSLENLISWRVEDSDIDKLNRAAGTEWLEVDEKTMEVLEKALQVAQATDGAYDPTILPVSSLWNFDSEFPTLPEKSQIEALLPDIGYSFLRINTEDCTASLRNHGNGLDLGGIGKGAGCDAALDCYRSAGIDGGIIAVGGSVGVYGEKPDGTDWRISVRDPEGEESDGIGVISLDKGCVSTSGSYEKTFTEDGVTYHHLLDAKTGYPAESGLVSVTVVHESGAISDALATACFVLGIEDSLPVLKELGASALFIDEEHHITIAGDLTFEQSSTAYTVSRQSL